MTVSLKTFKYYTHLSVRQPAQRGPAKECVTMWKINRRSVLFPGSFPKNKSAAVGCRWFPHISGSLSTSFTTFRFNPVQDVDLEFVQTKASCDATDDVIPPTWWLFLSLQIAFNVTVVADSCMKDQSFTIRLLGIKDTLTVSLSTSCECDCRDPQDSQHQLCGGRGSLTCGVCRWEPTWILC